jgi:hypothetical protein
LELTMSEACKLKNPAATEPASEQGNPATLAQALRRIFAGRREWRRQAKEHCITDETLVIAMPHCGSALNEIALGLIDRLIAQKRPDKTLILTPDKEILRAEPQLRGCAAATRVAAASADSLRSIMDYYCAHRCHRNFYVVSLTEPRGAGGAELLGVNGVTAEELVRLAILRLRG